VPLLVYCAQCSSECVADHTGTQQLQTDWLQRMGVQMQTVVCKGTSTVESGKYSKNSSTAASIVISVVT
jgi:hypothetical protein